MKMTFASSVRFSFLFLLRLISFFVQRRLQLLLLLFLFSYFLLDEIRCKMSTQNKFSIAARPQKETKQNKNNKEKEPAGRHNNAKAGQAENQVAAHGTHPEHQNQ